MGIAGASIYALYKPLAEKDDDSISQVIQEAKKYYTRSGFAFTVGSIVLALLYPFLLNDASIEPKIVSILFLLLSINTAMDFFGIAKYRVVFVADQKEYIISICNTVHLATYSLLAIMVINSGGSIIQMQFTLVTGYIVRFILLMVFFRNIYGSRFNKPLSKKGIKVNQKGYVMWHEISWLVISSTPIIIMTILFSLRLVSVYSVYNIVISNVSMLIAIFNTSFTAGFGELIHKKQYDTFSKIFHQYEFIYLSYSGVLLLSTMQVIQPFMNLYIGSVSDISYNNRLLVVLMIALNYSNSIRVPSNIIIGITGSYKQTIRSTIGVAVFCVIVSGIFAMYGFEYVLIGSSLSFLIRAGIFMMHAHKLNIGYKIKTSSKNIAIVILIFFTVSRITTDIVNIAPVNYTQWISNSFLIVFVNSCVYILLMFLFNYHLMNAIMHRLKRILI